MLAALAAAELAPAIKAPAAASAAPKVAPNAQASQTPVLPKQSLIPSSKAPAKLKMNSTKSGMKPPAVKDPAKIAAKAASKAELMAFVGNVTGRHQNEKGGHEARGSRGLGKLIAMCSAALLLPILLAVLLVLRARRKEVHPRRTTTRQPANK